jgi:nucleoside phosphorylase
LCGIAAGIQRRDKRTGKLKGPDVGDVIVGTYVHNAEYNKAEDGHLAPRYLPLGHPSLPLVSSYCRPLTRPGRSGWMTDALISARPSGSKFACHEGEIVAVDSVLGDPKNVHHAEITRRYDKAIGVDMESAGVGWAMHSNPQDVHYNPRWLCIRSVSDVVVYESVAHGEDADGEAGDAKADPHEMRNEWREPAAQTAAAFAHAVVQSLLSRERPSSMADPGAAAYRRPASRNDTPEPEPTEAQLESSDPTRTLKE